MLTGRRWFFLLLLPLVSLVAVACDPGWGYVVTGGMKEDDGFFLLPAQQDTGFRVAGSLFAFDLTVWLEITNLLDEPLSITPRNTAVLDAAGRALPLRRSPTCSGRQDQEVVQLAHDEICRLVAEFEVHPLVGRGIRGGKPNPDLRVITLAQDGISRQEQKIPVRIQMGWNR